MLAKPMVVRDAAIWVAEAAFVASDGVAVLTPLAAVKVTPPVPLINPKPTFLVSTKGAAKILASECPLTPLLFSAACGRGIQGQARA